MRTLTHRLGVLGAAAALAIAPVLTAPAHAQAGSRGSTAPAAAAAAASSPVQIYGAWLCGSDFCTWAAAPDMTTFDTQNHWMIDRGNGSPSVNLVVLAFVDPLKLLNGTTDAGDTNGVPNGMDQAVVNYFTSHGVRVMLSIGGITYTADWDTALTQNATSLGQKAAAVATQLGVGIEIDYENSSSPNLTGMQAFINAYRAAHPYDATGANPAARLTIDVAAGDRYLIALDQYATSNWLTTSNPVLDYANAMVPNKQTSTSGSESNWLEHVDGKPNYAPPIAPLAPAKFTGSVYVAGQSQVLPECNNFAGSLQNSTSSWVESVAPAGAGSTNGMLGFMFWAAGAPSTRGQTTFPPNSCQGGVGVGATTLSVPVPMPALRQN
ncbi:MAG TPA: glycosyl hydrolase family 18 protein [Actinocrinis sp.]|uniref:glycosyl hydrolase family 18 protein n=1 Tax=Actinocrinis sp. TaxID=1920516 RepID=UPI002DDCAC14|nr:glycosyl hydrolase family 18 protein [Actinocrinis sp.]HEV2342672.1 glycosyl hydrolase family 18 protein [Actinocrinis sp.]